MKKRLLVIYVFLLLSSNLFAHDEGRMAIPIEKCSLTEIWLNQNEDYPLRINKLREAITEYKKKKLPVRELQNQRREILNRLFEEESPEEISRLLLLHMEIENTATIYSRDMLTQITAGLIMIISTFIVTTIWLSFVSSSRKNKVKKEIELNSHIVSAQERERQRIARELHDTITQDIRTVLLYVRELKENTANENLLEKIESIECQNLKNLRNIIQNLTSEEIETEDFGKLISHHCASITENTKIPCSFFAPDNTDFSCLSTIQKLNIFRIIQEGVNNALKHANASSINIIARQESNPGRMIFFIRDDGEGIKDIQNGFKKNETEKHFGLKGMKYRADILHGELNISSSKEMGTEIKLIIPL